MHLLHYKYPTEQLGNTHYTLISLLGSGSRADVYLGQDEWEHHEVAIKVLRPDMLDPDTQERFLHGCEIAASLKHTHLISTYGTGAREEILLNPDPTDISEYKVTYVVMEYVKGGGLNGQLEPGQAYPLHKTVRIFEQLCAAVEYVHNRGVIHRDIKPSNILFREHRLKGTQVVLSGFDQALRIHSPHNLLPEVRTSIYMAPEQPQGHPAVVSDIYSLGMVLYQLCTGHLPSLSQTPTRPTLLNPNLPPALDAVILCALSNDPSQRYASASLFWQDIQSAVGGSSFLENNDINKAKHDLQASKPSQQEFLKENNYFQVSHYLVGQMPLLQSNKGSPKVEQPGTQSLPDESSSRELSASLQERSSTLSKRPIRIYVFHSPFNKDIEYVDSYFMSHLIGLTKVDSSISYYRVSYYDGQSNFASGRDVVLKREERLSEEPSNIIKRMGNFARRVLRWRSDGKQIASKISVDNDVLLVQEISERLRQVDIILLFVSPDYTASNICWNVMEEAMERHNKDDACVVPIILRPTDWEDMPFNELQVLPTGYDPMTTWPDPDTVGLDVLRGVKRVIEDWRRRFVN